jgi:UDPglucose--hexose-1-phosphate uridylyltransferase
MKSMPPKPVNEYPVMRRDPVTGDCVVFAPKRQARPHPATKKKIEDRFSAKKLEHEEIFAEFGRGADRITVIGNAFPVFGPQSPLGGHQEILVEGRANRKFSSFSANQMAHVLDAMAERVKDLRRIQRHFKYIVVFKNEGLAAGASQAHAHSQIFALPFVPDRAERMLANRRALSQELKASPHSVILAEATLERTIYKDSKVIAFADPFTPFSCGVRIILRRRIDNITQTTEAERHSLAQALHALMPLVRRNKWSYNFHFHDVVEDHEEPFEIRFIPRTNIQAGFEFDAGLFINPITPEQAAEEYRKAGRRA